MQLFIISVNASAILSASSFTNLTGIWTGPVEESLRSDFITCNHDCL